MRDHKTRDSHAKPKRARFVRSPRQSSGPKAVGPGLSKIAWITVLGLVAVFGGVILLNSRNTNRGEKDVARTSLMPGSGIAGSGAPGQAGQLRQGTNGVALSPEVQKEQVAANWNAEGNAMLRANDVHAAIRAYRQAVALQPADEDLHFNLGIAYARAGDTTNAEAEYNEALRLLPDYPEVHNNYGNLLLRGERLEEAGKHFSEAIRQMPEYAEAYNNLGVVLQRQRRTNEALASFQQAVQLETNYWQAHFNLASAYLTVADREKAVAAFQETLRLNPSFEPAQKALAKVLGPAPAVPQTPLR